MAEYSKIARGTVTTQANTPLVINLPFQPTLVKIQMNSSLANPNNGYIVEAYWDASMPQNTAIDKLYSITGTSPSTNYLTTSYQVISGISTFSRGLSASFGPQKQVVSSTKGDPTTFVVTNHGFAPYDYVLFEGLYNTGGATGMPQMCGIPFVVTVVDANTFTVPWVSNVPVVQVPGLSFPQMITAGDINTSGGSQLRFGTIPTINGPSINGAFVNNTSQGFIVSPTLFNSSQQNLSWEAYYFDLTVNG